MARYNAYRSHHAWETIVIAYNSVPGDTIMRLYPLFAALLLLALAAGVLGPIHASAEDEGTVKITVLSNTTFTNMTSYMLDTSANKLDALNTTYVQVLDYELKDLDSSDSYMPVVVVSLDAPTTDLNTNESIEYAYILSSTYGDGLLVGVADVNNTDNSISNLEFYKISPVTGDIMITRTSYDLNIIGDGYKLSIPLSNYTNPKVLIYTDSRVSVGGISQVELRGLRTPPDGYTLIRSGTGEAVFTISASGDLHVWFDESHDQGDVDLFVFDSSNQYYSSASTTQDWLWLTAHCSRYLLSDGYPWTSSLTAHGDVKFVVKRFSGNANDVSWRIAATLSSSNPSTTATQTPSSTSTVTANPSNSNARFSLDWGSIQQALGGGSNTAAYVVIAFIAIVVIILLARK